MRLFEMPSEKVPTSIVEVLFITILIKQKDKNKRPNKRRLSIIQLPYRVVTKNILHKDLDRTMI